MLTHLHPALSQLPPSIRGVLDLFTGFALVYGLRWLFTAFSRWRLIRSHPGESPVLHLRDVPGPNPPSWLWGSEWEMYNSDPGQKYLEWYDRFGRIVKFKGVLGVSFTSPLHSPSYLHTCIQSSFLSLADPSAIQYILGHQHCYEFPKPDGERQFFLTLLGKGLIWAEGEAHSRQRRILSPGFRYVGLSYRLSIADCFNVLSQEALRALSPIFIDSANKTAQAWNTTLEAASVDNAVIDVQQWANHISYVFSE
jgi:hypothetical protein